MENKREHWGSTWGFIMAAAGSAIGLGNIWRFPYITGNNGGGAFVLVYLGCIMLIGLPVMLGEFAMGRASQSDPIGAFKHFGKGSQTIARCFSGAGLLLAALIAAACQNYGLAAVVALISAAVWRWGFVVAGFFCSLVAVLILSYYAVIGGWILIYAAEACSGGLNFADSAAAKNLFVDIATNGWWSTAGMIAFMLICGFVCFFGVKKGVELASKIMMPVLFGLIVVLVIRALTLPGASAGVSFFLKPDFSKLSLNGVLEALGHAFYSLSLGMGILITYGSYLPRNRNILTASCCVAFFDTLLATLAGLAIFPAVFAMNMSPAQGPSLIFQVLPITFNSIPGSLGWLWNGLFFILMSIAALTSGISLLECGISTIMQHCKIQRRPAVIVLTVAVSALALLSAWGAADWSHLSGLKSVFANLFGAVQGAFLDELDYICSNWILPLNGLVIALFVGWIWGVGASSRELYRSVEKRFVLDSKVNTLRGKLNKQIPIKVWSLFVRFVAPVLVLLTFLFSTGLLNDAVDYIKKSVASQSNTAEKAPEKNTGK